MFKALSEAIAGDRKDQLQEDMFSDFMEGSDLLTELEYYSAADGTEMKKLNEMDEIDDQVGEFYETPSDSDEAEEEEVADAEEDDEDDDIFLEGELPEHF